MEEPDNDIPFNAENQRDLPPGQPAKRFDNHHDADSGYYASGYAIPASNNSFLRFLQIIKLVLAEEVIFVIAIMAFRGRLGDEMDERIACSH